MEMNVAGLFFSFLSLRAGPSDDYHFMRGRPDREVLPSGEDCTIVLHAARVGDARHLSYLRGNYFEPGYTYVHRNPLSRRSTRSLVQMPGLL